MGGGENQLDDLIKTGKIQAGTETFTSPTWEYIKNTGYEGVIIKFRMKKGTIDELKKIGTVRKTDIIKVEKYFGKMPINEKGWLKNNTLFKVEGTERGMPQINIRLGRDGKGIEIFNSNIIEFEMVK